MTENKEQLIFVDRGGTGCHKWDGLAEQFGRTDLLPMWIADMDIRCPQCVLDALAAQVEKGVFGYDMPTDDYYRAFGDWQARRHGIEVRREWLRFAPGLVPALNWCVQIYSEPGAGVVLPTPIYYPMLHAVKNNSRRLLAWELINDCGVYRMDLDQLELMFRKEKPQLLIFCSPHNPCGRVWTKEELQAVLALCRKYRVLMVSDEIHQDLIMPGSKQTPAALLADEDDLLISMTAPSKTFNLAGLQNSLLLIGNEKLREDFDRFTTNIRISYGCSPGYTAAAAAWRGGESWLDSVLELVWNNYLYLRGELMKNFPRLTVSPLQGTYLCWVDFRAYVEPDDFESFMLDRCRIAADLGSWFGGHAPCHGRFNLATSAANVKEAASRICDALSAINEGRSSHRPLPEAAQYRPAPTPASPAGR